MIALWRNLRLGRQIQLTLLALLSLALLVYATLIIVASERLEHHLLDSLVSNEAELIRNRLLADPGAQLPEQMLTLAWFATGQRDDAPPALSGLPFGISHGVEMDGRRLHVLREGLPQGVLTVAVDISAIEARESTLQLVVVSGGFGLLVLLALAGRMLTRRLATPLQSMAHELDALEPGQAAPAFLGRYNGVEAASIARALDAYIERLTTLIARERSFSAAASHELRTPLTVVRNAVELVAMDDIPNPASRQALQRALRQAGRLSEILDGLMLLARDQDAVELGDCDAAALLRECVDDLRDAQQKEVPIELDAPPSLRLNVLPAHWTVLVVNLIRNACEHGDGQAVAVSLSTRGLQVRDQGPGIDPAVLQRAFEWSVRGSHSKGAGLGLYIAAEICRRQNWEIRAERPCEGGFAVVVEFAVSH